jgi:UDP-glucuronate 4-epimerase
MTERILVTGAAGFIGGHTCRALLDRGCTVVGVDNFDPFYAQGIKEETVSGLNTADAFSFIEGDIRDASAVESLMPGVDAVVHLAARAGVRPSIEDPVLYSSVNVEGTVRLLEGCRQAGVRRFVFGSSSSVYGDDTPAPFAEDVPAVNPISPYAATKRAGELLCKVYHELYGMRIVALRFFTVYGHRQRPDLAIHKFTRLISSGSVIQQFGDGSAERDHTHVEDILKGVMGALEWTEASGPAFEIVNLGESRTVRLDRLIELIAAAVGVEPRIEMLPPQPGDVRQTYADISKARSIFGYDPQVSIEDGIVDFVNWYRSRNGNQSASTA